VHKAKLITDWHTFLLGQATLAAFIEQGAFARPESAQRLRDAA
jgi:hypothetical protein